MNKNKFKKQFKKISQKYCTPEKVQILIRALKYNRELKGETLKSAAATLKTKNAHCLEAAFLAAAILENLGYPPLVMSLESIDDLDHVVFVYKKNKKWGSIGCSRDEGLHGRKPVFRSLRDLALSYYIPYIDKTGCITGYQIAHLDDSNSNWRFSDKNVWKTEQYLIDLKHEPIKFNKTRHKIFYIRYLKGIAVKKQKSWL